MYTICIPTRARIASRPARPALPDSLAKITFSIIATELFRSKLANGVLRSGRLLLLVVRPCSFLPPAAVTRTSHRSPSRPSRQKKHGRPPERNEANSGGRPRQKPINEPTSPEINPSSTSGGKNRCIGPARPPGPARSSLPTQQQAPYYYTPPPPIAIRLLIVRYRC